MKVGIFSNTLKLPYYLVQIFTGKGGFCQNPLLGSKTLNILGLHVFRLCLTHFIYKIRYLYVYRMLPKEQRKFFNKNGYLCIKNALSEHTFQALVKDMQNYNSHGYYFIENDTKTWRALFSAKNQKLYKGMRSFFSEKNLFKIMQFCIRKYTSSPILIEQIQQGEKVGALKDPQYWFHSDTFFPTIKMWIFLEDVTLQNGPFEYIPGSHKLTWKRIKWEYRRSINYKERGKRIPGDQAPRYVVEDFKELGISPENSVEFEVPANTLIIGNTYGIHRRSKAQIDSANRLQIYASLRPNPFNFFPGFGVRFNNIFNTALLNLIATKNASWLPHVLLKAKKNTIFDYGKVRD